MNSGANKITLSRQQLEFLVYMLEIQDPIEAVQKFAVIMVEERMAPKEMGAVIDRIIKRMKR